jgi:hypothetical protein
MPFRLGALGAALLAALVGLWWYRRWQAERNRPINRLRRQVKAVTSDLGERLPSAAELAERVPGLEQVPPAGRLGVPVLLALLVLLARARRAQSQPDSTMDTATDAASTLLAAATSRAGAARDALRDARPSKDVLDDIRNGAEEGVATLRGRWGAIKRPRVEVRWS